MKKQSESGRSFLLLKVYSIEMKLGTLKTYLEWLDQRFKSNAFLETRPSTNDVINIIKPDNSLSFQSRAA